MSVTSWWWRGGHRAGVRLAHWPRAGCSVTVCDPPPAARPPMRRPGMLAPVTEAHYGEDRLLRPQPRRRRALAGLRRGAGGRVRSPGRLPHLRLAARRPRRRRRPGARGPRRLPRPPRPRRRAAQRERQPGGRAEPRPPGCAGACGSSATTRPTTGSWPTPCWPPSRPGAASTVVEQVVDRIDVVDGAVAGVTLADGVDARRRSGPARRRCLVGAASTASPPTPCRRCAR